MIYILEEIFCEYLEPSLCGTALIRNYLRIFFVYLIRSSNGQMTDLSDSNITEMLYYIEEHSQDCTLKSLATEFDFNPKYIMFLLKEKTEKSFTELLASAPIKFVL